MKPYIDSPEENAIREANYRAKIDRMAAISEQEEAHRLNNAYAYRVALENKINAENERFRAIYQSYVESMKGRLGQQVMNIDEYISQYKANCLSQSWWKMINFAGNKFTREKFDSKKGLCYRYTALKKIQEDAEIGMGVSLELMSYLEIKEMPLETIHIYFEMFIKQYCYAYQNFVEQQSSL